MIHEITVQVPEAQLVFFQQLMQQLNFTAKMPKLKKKKPAYEDLNADQKWFVDTMREALNMVDAAERGEIQLQSVKDMLDEIEKENAEEAQAELVA
jgi:hypothetical protein